MLVSNLFLVHVYNHPAELKWSKKTIEEPDYGKEIEKTVVIHNITDSDVINASQSAQRSVSSKN